MTIMILISLLCLFILSSAILVFLLIGEQQKRSANLNEIAKLHQQVEAQKRKIKDFENKRDAYRLDVLNEKCTITFPEITLPGFETLSYEKMIAYMKNISFNGAKIACDFDIPIRDKIIAGISFEFKNEKFECEALFLRKEEFLHQVPHLVYGLRFMQMDAKMQERLKLILNYAQAERYKGKEPAIESN